MEYISYKWLDEPEKYYPEPKTIANCIKWHIAISNKAEKIHQEINEDVYKEMFIDVSKLKNSPEADALLERDQEYICSLGYTNVALIEAAMLLGRELFYKNRNGFSDYDEEINDIGVRDLSKWLDVFDIPESIETGGDLVSAVEYTLSKRTCFLQAYINELEGSACA